MTVGAGTDAAPVCPRCAGPSVRTHPRGVPDRNRRVSEVRFHYRRCAVCKVEWLPEPPADLPRYYPSGYHAFHTRNELPAAAAKDAERLGFVTEHVTGGRLVEIGPSQGSFAFGAAQAGFEVTGLEMDAACCRSLEEVVGVRAINTAQPAEVLATLEPSRAIVMWHVLEHIVDPWTLLETIAANLEPGGVLALAMPNPQSLQRRLFGSHWVHFDAPRHVQFIPLAALVDQARQLGMELQHATTADAFGRECNLVGWQRSLLPGAKLRPDPRAAWTIEKLLGTLARRFEEQGLRGTTYTAVFRKRPA